MFASPGGRSSYTLLHSIQHHLHPFHPLLLPGLFSGPLVLSFGIFACCQLSPLPGEAGCSPCCMPFLHLQLVPGLPCSSWVLWVVPWYQLQWTFLALLPQHCCSFLPIFSHPHLPCCLSFSLSTSPQAQGLEARQGVIAEARWLPVLLSM